MTHSDPNTGKTRQSLRKRVLLGTALAAIIGGAVIGENAFLPNSPALAQPLPAAPVQQAQVPDFADLVQRVSPAVVSIRVREAMANAALPDDQPFFNFRNLPPGSPLDRFFGDQAPRGPQGQQQAPRQRQAVALGSGFFISDDGYVVTNNHVVDNATTFTVITQDGTEYNAKLIGKDDKTDLALLKVDAKEKFAYVKFSPDPVRVGQWVLAVGNPFGLGGTVTAGIVSANGRQIDGGLDDYIQIDAAVNRGNSGGPTFNLKGEVIGINSAIYSPSGGNVGIAFAIPARTAEHVIQSLRDNGTVVRGWLGVQIQPVTAQIAESLRLGKTRGALVSQPQSGSPAAAAGIRAGDTILAINGKEVRDPRDLAQQVADLAPGTTVTLSVWRDGQQKDVQVKLGSVPNAGKQAQNDRGSNSNAPAAKPATLEGFGLQLAPTRNQDGVVVAGVDPNGPAAESGISEGDVIVSVSNKQVSAPADVEREVAAAKQNGLKAVLFQMKTDDGTRFVALPFEHA